MKSSWSQALKLLINKAEVGKVEAQYELGKVYSELNEFQDYVLAHMWFNLASSRHKDGVKNKNLIEKKMSPQQIAEAQRLARNWKPKK